MAIGKFSDFQIYDDQFQTGATETLQQETEIFNANSNGAIVLNTKDIIGHYERMAFFGAISGLASRRDITSVAAATDIAVTQGENVSVKLNRKIGPIAQTMDALRKIASDERELSFLIGQQAGKAIAVDYVDTALAACRSAVHNVAALLYDHTATGVLNHMALVNGMAKFGDASSRIRAFVMHSKSWFDLMGNAVSDNVFQVGGVTIVTGSSPTFNRPVIITDSPSLITTGSPNVYHVLGLVEGAVLIEESEGREMVADQVTGLENLVIRMQGEYAYNLSLKGFTWDVTNGGINPAAAAVATATNWDQTAASIKDCAGIVIDVD